MTTMCVVLYLHWGTFSLQPTTGATNSLLYDMWGLFIGGGRALFSGSWWWFQTVLLPSLLWCDLVPVSRNLPFQCFWTCFHFLGLEPRFDSCFTTALILLILLPIAFLIVFWSGSGHFSISCHSQRHFKWTFPTTELCSAG